MKYSILALTLICSLSVFASDKKTEKLANAVEDNNINSARKAILEGADVNAMSTTSSILLRAVKLNRIEIVKLLLDNNADINQVRPIDLFSGLMIAAKYNNTAMANLLIARGIDVRLATVINRNALHVAALNNSVDVAKILVNDTEIDINARGNLCALAIAARQDRREIVSLLKSQTGPKAASVKCLESAIHMADFNNHAEVMRILKE